MTRLAYAYPDSVQVIVKKGALEAAKRISRIYPGAVDAIQNFAKFLVAVCRGENLSLEKFTSDEVISGPLFYIFFSRCMTTIYIFKELQSVCR